MAERWTAPHGRLLPSHDHQPRGVALPALSTQPPWCGELLAGRGIEVSYESIRRWVTRFGLRLAEDLRTQEANPGRMGIWTR
jgi:hypothetical protein